MTDVPEEHQAGCAEMEAVQSPERSERQTEQYTADLMWLYNDRSLFDKLVRQYGWSVL
jgi:hypothetical protein